VPIVSVHVDGVAKLLFIASCPKINVGENFIASSGGANGAAWNGSIEIVNRNLPQAVKSEILPNNYAASNKKVKVDTGKRRGIWIQVQVL
jgi:hypothetical protein